MTVFPGLDADTGLAREFAEFEKRTGINVELTAIDAEAAVSFEPGEPNHRPDIYIFGHAMPAWAQPRAIDIGQLVDPETLRSDFGEYLLGFGRVDGATGVGARDGRGSGDPHHRRPEEPRVLPEGRVREGRLPDPDDLGRAPRLSSQVVADGGTPWRFGFESGDGSGWPGTDFIESLVLRVGGVDTYDVLDLARSCSPALR